MEVKNTAKTYQRAMFIDFSKPIFAFNVGNIYWICYSIIFAYSYINFIIIHQVYIFIGGRALSPFFGPLQKPKYESYRTTISSRCFIS